jgi:DNA (cytosine-5)-methyltransferase 1
MKYIDLFGGIGGFRYGIEKATKGEWECVWYNDYDKYAVQTYNKNYGTNYKPTDITKVKTEDIPDHDCICGGFPCQSFSIAGKRKGFEDIRGTMFFEIARILKAKRPKFLFLENVKGLLNHEKGKTFTTILQTLEELGYETQWMVLNSKFFGVPQNRERVFIIGNLRGEPRPEILPFRGIQGEDIKINQLNNPSHSNNRVYGIEGISPTLNTMGGGHRQPKIYCVDDGASPNFQAKMINQSPALKATRSNYEIGMGDKKIRKLTPVECERLQGFPDNWTEGVSNRQRYKQCGNAVTTKVIESIVSRWMDDI